MKRAAMLKSCGGQRHENDAPEAWHDVPDVTGDYDLDATILHRENTDLPVRLALYVKRDRNAYGAASGYGAYHGYGKDA